MKGEVFRVLRYCLGTRNFILASPLPFLLPAPAAKDKLSGQCPEDGERDGPA